MEDQWIYRRTNVERGRVPLAKLRELAAAGYLQPFDLIRQEGSSQWQPIILVEDLAPWLSDSTSESELQFIPASEALAEGTPAASRIEVGGLVFDEPAKNTSNSENVEFGLEFQPLPPATHQPDGTTAEHRHEGLLTSRRLTAAGIAAIVLISFGIVGAMVDHSLRPSIRHAEQISLANDASPAPLSPGPAPSGQAVSLPSTPVIQESAPPPKPVENVTRAPSTQAKPASRQVVRAAPPPAAASPSAESLQHQLLGEWRGVGEPTSLTFHTNHAILSTDGQFFQILPYTLNASDGTASLHESAGRTILLKLGDDHRLYSRAAGTDKAIIFSRQ